MGQSDAIPPASDDFNQLQLLFSDPLQREYEVIRPIVLFAETVTARSEQTSIDRSTVGEKARRFIQDGMLGLVDQRSTQSGRKPHTFPDPVARHILYLKQLYPPIHDREIVRIIERKFGYKTNHHTVKHFLERFPIPVQLPLDWTFFHDFEDAYRARWRVVRMYYEGWHIRSIAGCLKLSRQHVHKIIAAFERDGFAGLEDQRTRPPDHPANQLTLPLMEQIRDIQQEYPRAGRFRVRGLLEQRMEQPPPSEATIGRVMAKNRDLAGAPPVWSTDRVVQTPDGTIKALLYQPDRRHQYWFIDLRYIRKLNGAWIYSICILEGYSRKILAGMASVYQDLIAVLQIVVAAITEYGRPWGIVSDNGAVFTAHAYCSVLSTLGIEPCYIEKGKPWQNLLEAQFKVQVRLAQAQFDKAETLAAVQAAHATFVETFNTTAHGAHQHRQDGARTPLAVLRWVRGRMIEQQTLEAAVRTMHYERAVDRHGYISVQRFYLYAERGLARQRVSVWLYEGRLQIEYQQTMLAHYAYRYDRKRKRLRTVSDPHVQQTIFSDPQMELWELSDEQWHKVLERVARPRQPKASNTALVEQLSFQVASLILLVLASATYTA
jgi:transposase InsO family protein